MRPGLANARGEQGGDYVPSSKSWVWRLMTQWWKASDQDLRSMERGGEKWWVELRWWRTGLGQKR